MPAILFFDTWRPLLRSLCDCYPAVLSRPGACIAGRVTRDDWQWHVSPGRCDDAAERDMDSAPACEHDLFAPLQAALKASPVAGICFTASYPGPGRAVIHLFQISPAVEMTSEGTPGSVVLVEGAVPALWRRRPVPVPGALPSKSADPVLLERALRARLPRVPGAAGVSGVSGAHILAAGHRIGITFPGELRVLYQVLPRWPYDRDIDLPFEPLPVDEVYVATADARRIPWRYAAERAASTAPGAAVQALAGSPGWLVFGEAGDEKLAVDLTPGPGGHVGQIIMIDDAHWHAPTLLADSLTDLIVHRPYLAGAEPLPGLPAVARVGWRGLPDIESAVSPDLEVLLLVNEKGAPPLSLAPAAGLRRLRTLITNAGCALADPREIAGLPGLEYLQTGVAEWRILLRAHLVPRTLLAAGVAESFWDDPVGAVEVANALLDLRGRQKIGWRVLEGRI